MKRIGLLGGMSWESSVLYEELINTEVRERLGGTNSADLIVRSYNFATIEALQVAGDWERAAEILVEDAKLLEAAGAEVIALCTNTMHRVAESIEDAVDAQFVHICDAVSSAVVDREITNIGLLGTKFTMEQPFYSERLRAAGLEVIVPTEDERELIHKIIYDELVQGVLTRSSQEEFLDVIDRLRLNGSEGVIAGCTEIELLVSQDEVFVPYFPSTEIHARSLVTAALD